jgi:hypothetical protein
VLQSAINGPTAFAAVGDLALTSKGRFEASVSAPFTR